MPSYDQILPLFYHSLGTSGLQLSDQVIFFLGDDVSKANILSAIKVMKGRASKKDDEEQEDE